MNDIDNEISRLVAILWNDNLSEDEREDAGAAIEMLLSLKEVGEE